MKLRSLRLYLGLLALALCALGANAAPALALSPAVETLAASAIAEKGATLNGKVNPNGAETKMYFEYGTTTSYGSKTSEVSVGSGTTTLEKSQAISGLSANTTYHYRVVASNSAGSSHGIDRTFTTAGAPTVSGLETSEVGGLGEEATLKALVDPNGQSTTYQFEYGLSEGSLTNIVPVPAGSAGNGFEPTSVDATATGLTPGTKYFVRVSATNAGGKVTSSVSTFTSSLAPEIETVSVSNVGYTSATLNATITSFASGSSYYFEYGTTASYGNKTTTKEFFLAKNASEPISGLKENTLYHYRIVATNKEGTHTGTDQTFTTLGPATLYPKGGSEPLKSGAPLKLLSSNVSFSGGSGNHSCTEGELSGALKENPGALQSVTTLRMQTGLFYCEWKTNYQIKYSMPGGFNIEYLKGGNNEAFLQTGKFALIQTVYFNWFSKVAECEYNLTLAGSSAATAIEPTLSGTTEVVKGNASCPGVETVSGKFVLTSEGTAVEAK